MEKELIKHHRIAQDRLTLWRVELWERKGAAHTTYRVRLIRGDSYWSMQTLSVYDKALAEARFDAIVHLVDCEFEAPL